MLASEIITKVPSAFDSALASGDLFFFPSTIHTHEENGVKFEIRHCPALQKKPTLPTLHTDTPVTEKPDPFLPPYNPALFVGYLRGDDEDKEEYVVLLNKYSVIPHHFLLVTKSFKSQSAPLMPDDLMSAYNLIMAAYKNRKNLMAFYNCGDLSGASQAHKHMQFLFLENDDGPPVEEVARALHLDSPDKPFTLPSLACANHVIRFPSRFTSSSPIEREQVLTNAFINLYDLSVSSIRHDNDYPAGKPSYNVVITLEHMYIIPRRFEYYKLGSTGDDISVNSLAFAGMLLVKSATELESVKLETVGKILRGVGLESVHDIQVAGTSAEADEITGNI